MDGGASAEPFGRRGDHQDPAEPWQVDPTFPIKEEPFLEDAQDAHMMDVAAYDDLKQVTATIEPIHAAAAAMEEAIVADPNGSQSPFPDTGCLESGVQVSDILENPGVNENKCSFKNLSVFLSDIRSRRKFLLRCLSRMVSRT